MFKEMLAGMRILVGGAWVSTVALLVFIWRNLLARYALQRKEDRGNCNRCNGAHTREFTDLWETVDIIAPRSPEAQMKVKQAKKRLSTGENV
jgi:predicted methyltransferase